MDGIRAYAVDYGLFPTTPALEQLIKHVLLYDVFYSNGKWVKQLTEYSPANSEYFGDYLVKEQLFLYKEQKSFFIVQPEILAYLIRQYGENNALYFPKIDIKAMLKVFLLPTCAYESIL